MSSLSELVERLDSGAPINLETDGAWAVLLGEVDASALPSLALQPTGWSSATVGRGPGWELVLFGLSEGNSIPLHDHPGMQVLTRAVRGELRVESWDLPDPSGEGSAVIHGPAEPSLLTTPTRGNVHCVTALEDTWFLDLLSPPYDPPRRGCTYFRLERSGAQARLVPIPRAP